MKNVFRICIILGIVGLTLIYASSVYIEPENVEVSEVKPQWNGKQVTVNGTVKQPFKTKGNLFFTLEDSTGTVKVAEFGSNRTLMPETAINVTGRVTLYRGNLEIIASSIEK